MGQTRLVLMVGGGVLLLCVLALVVTLADYTSQQPRTASAHVPPVVGQPVSDARPTAVPTIPATTDPPSPSPQPSASLQRGRLPGSQLTLAQLLQQLEARRHHRPPQ